MSNEYTLHMSEVCRYKQLVTALSFRPSVIMFVSSEVQKVQKKYLLHLSKELTIVCRLIILVIELRYYHLCVGYNGNNSHPYNHAQIVHITSIQYLNSMLRLFSFFPSPHIGTSASII